MHEFRVWAPRARTVELHVDGERVSMTPLAGGTFTARVATAIAGSRYGFSLDGGPVRPDPRAPSQPDGIDGLSAVVDHGAFTWSDHAWRGVPLRGAVLYELHVGTFTPEGTFDAVIDHLEHLVSLGVDAVELLPVAEFAGERGWGYDGVDLFAPHHSYGGPDGLKRLIDACHRAGLGVVIDVVYNHLGPAGNYLGEFGPYFSERHQTNWGAAMNYDGRGSDEVRRFVLDNATQWLSHYHADGLRLDAVHAIVDDSAVHLLEELAAHVDALAVTLRRPVFLIAESDRNDPRLVRSRDAGGFGLDAAWADEWHHALHAALSGERSGYYEDFGSLELLAKALRQAWVYDGAFSPHRQRRHGRRPDGLAGYRFVVCTQNHDQVGNRARGERSACLMSPGRLRIAAALLLSTPFIPMVFQGEEWGASTPFQYFTDHRDPELARAVTEGRRHEFAAFGWDPAEVPDPQSQATLAASILDWEECGRGEHAEILGWYRELLTLRRQRPELSDPRSCRIDAVADETRQILTVRRSCTWIVVNLAEHTQSVPVARPRLLAVSAPGVVLRADAVVLVPDSVAIVGVAGG